jgi:hypothetical protein
MIILPTFVFGLFLGMKRANRTLASYCLMLDGEKLIRIQQGLPDVTIRQNE